MNEKKRSLKGTTLVEIIISLAVFAMLGVILVQVGTAIDKMNKSTNRLNKRVNIQAPYAASQSTKYRETVVDDDGNVSVVENDLDANSITIDFSIDDSNGIPERVDVNVPVMEEDPEHPGDYVVKYQKQKIEAKVVLPANSYSTKKIVENNSNVYRDNEANRNHHLQFAVLDDTTLNLTPLMFDLTNPDTPSFQYITSYYGYRLADVDSWESDDPSVAEVNQDGRVTPNASGPGGICWITAKKGESTYRTYVTVIVS